MVQAKRTLMAVTQLLTLSSQQINLERTATTSTLFRTGSGTNCTDCAYTHAKDPVSLGIHKADKATNQATRQQPSRPKTLLLTSGKRFTFMPQPVLFGALACLSENVSLSQSSLHANETPVKIGQPLRLNWTPPLLWGNAEPLITVG